MNQRIRELAEQAKVESSQWLGSKPAITITYDELEKFAELIVKECCQKLENDGMVEVAMEMKQHFGVEE